jgi:cytochrome c oxidase subunit I
VRYSTKIRWTDHKTVGLQYALTALFFLFVGFLLMLVMRWQLAWPTSPLPALMAAAVGEANAPGGYVLPEFYNQLVAMHGTVMIFLAVVPMLTGAFGNYLVPLQIGAPDMAFPRLNATSYWLYLVGGLVMLTSFFVPGGAANSGWTSYPPLAVFATRGQDLWLVGIFFFGLSSTLNAINVIATIVQLRAEGLTFFRLPFFVWAQLITALLLLLAFPALQAAAIFQLMDRLAGTSFFLPSGLYVAGAPLQGAAGGGNPLLWQHLFWFLGHPEVYVLILPAIGIVAEVIANNTRRPLWGYRAMVGAVLFMGGMSMIVWAHHMFLTGMGTRLSTFFQLTTMIISIPSVILVTSLMLSLWGGSIRFTTPMLFALAFLPMFGIGGLTGLPLGLAASDIELHDTWYVVGHFHYLVAPGTIFAIFAGIYHWFPKVTGRALNRRLGFVHFWGSLIAMNAIFLPMFVMGLHGVNRRLYDGGLQYTHAQPVLGLHAHMTYAALALGAFQLAFLINIGLSLWRGAAVSDNPWEATTLEWQASSPPGEGNFAEAPRVFRGAYEYSVAGAERDFVPQTDPA